MDAKATGVTITTIKLNAWLLLARMLKPIEGYKVHTQFADVDNAFAGARIRSGTISAGYNQVIPSQPIAKKVLKMKRKSAATMPVPFPVYLSYIALSQSFFATLHGVLDAYHDRQYCHRESHACGAEQHARSESAGLHEGQGIGTDSWRRPNFSIVKTAIHEAAKYSVVSKLSLSI